MSEQEAMARLEIMAEEFQATNDRTTNLDGDACAVAVLSIQTLLAVRRAVES